MTTHAVTYCRISADKLEQGAGVDRQRIDTERVCETNGWAITERLVDNDRSASKYARKTREGWMRLLELLEAKQVDAVVAYDLDRLTRKPDELAPLIVAAERGVKIVTVTGSVLNLSTADGIFASRILLAVAEKEAANASRRQIAKLRHDADAGRPHWPRRPFGFTLDGEIVPAEAEWVRSIASWIADDGMSATQVARRLNEAGVAQPSGARWQSAGVRFMVTSPRIVGLRTYHGKVIGPGSWPALIDQDRWRDACAALDLHSTGIRGRRSMLTGLVRCGVCGERMVRTNASTKGEWRCMKRADVGTGCGQAINARRLEELISAMVLVRLGDVKARKREPRDTVDPMNDADQIRADLATLADMVGRGQMSMTEWQAARAPLTTRLATAEAAEARGAASVALARLAGDEATLSERWDELDDDLRRRLIGLVLDQITVNAGRRGVLDLGRIVPVWR